MDFCKDVKVNRLGCVNAPQRRADPAPPRRRRLLSPKGWELKCPPEGSPTSSIKISKNRRQLQQVCVQLYLFHHRLEGSGVSPLECMQFGLEGGKDVLNDPFDLLTVQRASAKFTLIPYWSCSSAMIFVPAIAPHLSVDVGERLAESVSENHVKASFGLQQTVFPARGCLVETPTATA